MPKLHLKRTPEEEAVRRLRKKEKKDAKRRRKEDHYNSSSSSSKRRRRTAVESSDKKYDYEDDEGDDDGDDFIGPVPGPSDYQPDYETIRSELEEIRFREKMAMAFEDDERLDSVEARFNSFAHVPMHWGGTKSSKPRINYDNDEFLAVDPMSMDDEEYAEWIRMGMYRKTHVQEIAEKERLKAERAAKRAYEKSVRAETERLEKLAAAEHRSRKQEKENQKLELLRLEYHNRWKVLLSNIHPANIADIGFHDIPWPILLAYKQKSNKISASDNPLSLGDFTRDAISTFLFTSSPFSANTSIDTDIGKTSSSSSSAFAQRPAETEMETVKKDRKEKLREALLRFHPDKFEGRLMPRVRPSERDKVAEALYIVVRVLNDLMGEG
ncbi:hypothetical protein J3R30DRAFT_1791244 [Lentinula aciculospora]|uniref:Uncharacterized protein n=1 Tax=Lentinula aciculospora TaxID=153920 RepID=A0A9W9AIP6_9AGAR|nr:hypothetical protein J3R30DRAFT_1791244 [Lentinula aciculospora]